MQIAFISAALIASIPLLHDPIVDSPRGRALSRDLVRRNGIGDVDGTEAAAFVVDRGEGALAFVAWPSTHQYQRETFQGEIPAGAIAIIHTHPWRMPFPSEQDIIESHRLRIPIYVLTRNEITKAVPWSFRPVVVHRGAWVRPPDEPPLSASVTAPARTSDPAYGCRSPIRRP